MDAKGKPAGRGKLHLLARERFQAERPHPGRDGTRGLWLVHLCFQVRRGSTARIDSHAGLPDSHDASVLHVLDRHWRRRPRRDARQRRHGWRRIIACAIWLNLLWLSACKPEPPPDSQYWAARAKFQQGYIDVAIELAARSLQKIEPQDPAWGWKFRVLEADMLMWRGAPEQVL